MNKKQKEILDKIITESDNLQGAKIMLKELKKELYAFEVQDE